MNNEAFSGEIINDQFQELLVFYFYSKENERIKGNEK